MSPDNWPRGSHDMKPKEAIVSHTQSKRAALEEVAQAISLAVQVVPTTMIN